MYLYSRTSCGIGATHIALLMMHQTIGVFLGWPFFLVLLSLVNDVCSFSSRPSLVRRSFSRLILRDNNSDMMDHKVFGSESSPTSYFHWESAQNKTQHLSIPPSFRRRQRRETPTNSDVAIQAAMESIGMPWMSSIDPTYDPQDDLTYMKFWNWQLNFMQEHLTDLRVLPSANHDGSFDFSYCDTATMSISKEQPARVANLAFASQEYRKIRMTYYDAGPRVQVFNSLWYPSNNLPVLGIDLLQFHHGKKHLCVVDFQPTATARCSHTEDDCDNEVESAHDAPYHYLMEPIARKYSKLQQGSKMSKRFYDESQFFSPHKLFTRFEDESMIETDVLPAFQEYVKAHVCDLVKPVVRNTLTKTTTSQTVSLRQHIPVSILERQQAYDAYSADRDPAKAMFARVFGPDWADAYVHEFLFDLSRVDDLLSCQH